MTEFKLFGTTYDVQEGSVITVPDDEHTLGSWLKVTTKNYEITATQISIDDENKQYRIDKIIIFDMDSNSVVVEETEKEILPSQIEIPANLSKLKKDELINLGEQLGFDISKNMTKNDIIKLIEG